MFHCVHFECPAECNALSEYDQGRCSSTVNQDFSAGANGLVLSSRRMDLPEHPDPHEDEEESRENVAAAIAMAPMAHLPPTNPVLGSQQQQGIPQNMPLLDRGENFNLPVGIVRPRGSNNGMAAGMQGGFSAMSQNPVGANANPGGGAAGGAGPLGAVGGASNRSMGAQLNLHTPPPQPQTPPGAQSPRSLPGDSPQPETTSDSSRSSRSGGMGGGQDHSRSSSNSSGSPASPR